MKVLFISIFQILVSVALADYAPSAKISRLANDVTMTDSAKKLFFLGSPEIADRKTLTEKCHQYESSSTLGCLDEHGQMFLFDLTEPRLQGIFLATAAHEMLHEAYLKLAPNEKARIDNLTDLVRKSITDKGIIKRLEIYKREKIDEHNELHSIIGSEIATLPKEFEAYYAQYFSNRQKLISLFSKSISEFTLRKAKADEYGKDLPALDTKIENQKLVLKSQAQMLDDYERRLDALRSANRVTEYNQLVANHNHLIRTYNLLVKSLREQTTKYNEIVYKINDLAGDYQELNQALDSHDVTTRKSAEELSAP